MIDQRPRYEADNFHISHLTSFGNFSYSRIYLEILGKFSSRQRGKVGLDKLSVNCNCQTDIEGEKTTGQACLKFSGSRDDIIVNVSVHLLWRGDDDQIIGVDEFTFGES